MGDEIRITYETLYDLLRREKGRDELQKLEASFLSDVEDYLTEKQSIATGPNESFFSEEERQKTQLQLVNVARLIKELYDRREKKILLTALIKARMQKALIDTAAMLSFEKSLFEQLVRLLDEQRQSILGPLFAAEKKGSGEPQPEPQPLKNDDQPNSITVQFLTDVPRFVGKSLEIYGPYIPGDQAMLPAEIAKILIDKGRAKEAEAVEEATS